MTRLELETKKDRRNWMWSRRSALRVSKCSRAACSKSNFSKTSFAVTVLHATMAVKSRKLLLDWCDVLLGESSIIKYLNKERKNSNHEKGSPELCGTHSTYSDFHSLDVIAQNFPGKTDGQLLMSFQFGGLTLFAIEVFVVV